MACADVESGFAALGDLQRTSTENGCDLAKRNEPTAIARSCINTKLVHHTRTRGRFQSVARRYP